MKLLTTSALLLFCLPLLLYAQDQDGDFFFDKAGKYYVDFKYDSAAMYFEKAEHIYAKEESYRYVLKCLNNQAQCLVKTGNYSQAHAKILSTIGLCELHYLDDIPELSVSYMILSTIYRKINKPQDGHEAALKAYSVAKKTVSPNDIKIAEALNAVASSYSSVQQYEKALIEYKKVLKVLDLRKENSPSFKAGILNNMGIMYEHTHNISLALKYYRQAYALRQKHLPPDHPEIANNLHNIGNILRVKGHIDSALMYYERSIAISKKTDKESLKTANTYNSLSIIYYDKKEFTKCRDYLIQCLRLQEEILGLDHWKNAIILHNLGEISIKGFSHKKKALEYFNRAISIYKNYTLEAYLAETYLEMAKIYKGQALLENTGKEQCLSYYSKALSIFKEKQGKNGLDAGRVYRDMGKAHKAFGDIQKAKSLLQKGVDILTSQLPLQHELVINAYINYASSFNNDTLLRYINLAIDGTMAEGKNHLPDQLPKIDDIYFPSLLLDAIAVKAQHFANTANAPQRALLWFKTGLKIFEQGAENLFMHQGKQSILAQYSDFFNSAITFSAKAYHTTSDNQYLHFCWKVMEYLKLLKGDHFTPAEEKIKTLAKTDTSVARTLELKQKITALRKELYYEMEYPSAANEDVIKELRADIFNRTREYEKLQKGLTAKYPKYFQTAFKAPSSIKHIQTTLPEHTALLNYYYNDSILVITCITPDKYTLHYTLPEEDINVTIYNYREALQQDKTEDAHRLAHTLYQALWKETAPILDNTEHIIIIPHAQLYSLPFALLSPSGENDFLFLNYTFLYHFSAASWAAQQAEKKDTKKKRWLGIAPVEFDNIRFSKTLLPLPWTQFEIQTIRKTTGGHIVIKNEATEEFIKQAAANYGQIHIASHAVIDHENPKFSRLALYTDSTSSEDGWLHAYEFPNLHLNAVLITLSACNTISGTDLDGDAFSAFAGDVLYSGTDNLMTTIWEIPDKETAQYMQHFYTFLTQGHTIPTAIQKSQIEMYKNENAISPLAYGGFMLYGQGHAVHTNDRSLFLWIGAIAVVLILAGLWVRRKQASPQ